MQHFIKLVGLLCILLGLLIYWSPTYKTLTADQRKIAARILISNDFINLKENTELKDLFTDLQSIELNPNLGPEIIGFAPLSIKTKPKGRYRLQMKVVNMGGDTLRLAKTDKTEAQLDSSDDLDLDPTSDLVIQYDVLDAATGEKIDEVGRTIGLEKLDVFTRVRVYLCSQNASLQKTFCP